MALASLRLTYSYPQASAAALAAEVELDPGLTLVAGASGSGKSTLLRTLNGLVPHFHGGRIEGRAVVCGMDVLRTPTRTLARRVGFVFQDPEQQAVYASVEREVAFGLENLAVPRAQMEELVTSALAAAGADHLRGRRLAELSGGERQRVAIASALALQPDVLVLDEPTSQLDSGGADLVLGACLRLAGSGRAVVVSEHRLERLLPASEALLLVDRGRVRSGPARALAAHLASPPAVISLGRRLAWSPLPLTVAAARPLRPPLKPAPPRAAATGAVAWWLGGVSGREGEVVVLMGPNGGGKTMFLRALAGLRPGAERLPGRVAYLPQNPIALLHRPTVRDEVKLTLGRAGESEPPVEILRELGIEGLAERYPRDLSSGERQRAALAAVLCGTPRLALLDEPTRGMDGATRARLRALIERLKVRGAAVVLATHDSDLAAEVGDRVLVIEDGRAREAGSPESALSGESPIATQIGRLYPGGPVTVEGVLARL
ncbi:MAG TPA: ATP-binding cassette domain-containing protein [Candidatus Dormibacteraeota bacterium]